MRGKSEDLSVGALARPESRARYRSTTERELARESTLVSLCERACGALFSVVFFCSACSSAGTDSAPQGDEHSCPSRFATSVQSFIAGPRTDLRSGQIAGCGARSAQGRRSRQWLVRRRDARQRRVDHARLRTYFDRGSPGSGLHRVRERVLRQRRPGRPVRRIGELSKSATMAFITRHFRARPARHRTKAARAFIRCTPTRTRTRSMLRTLWSPAAMPSIWRISPCQRAQYVRITDRVDLTGANGTFDLDAVSIVNADCP